MFLNNVLNCETPQNCLDNIIWTPLAAQHIASEAEVDAALGIVLANR